MQSVVQRKKPMGRAKSFRASTNSQVWSSQSQAVQAILHLQRAVGNQPVRQSEKSVSHELNAALAETEKIRSGQASSRPPMLMPWHLQVKKKLSISSPGDISELEADRVAAHIMQMPDPTVQRQAVTYSSGEKKLIERKSNSTTQRQHGSKQERQAITSPRVAPKVALGVENDILPLIGSGQPLSVPEREFFEPRFGEDFSDVRVHTDYRAARASESIDARAFTFGRDIVFGIGEYSPTTSSSRELLAHELTHVVQQRGAPTIQRKIKTGNSVSLDAYFSKKIPGYSVAGGVYSAPDAKKASVRQQILSDLLSSGRVFSVPGKNQNDVVSNLEKHIGSREDTVKFAKNRRYGFGAGKKMKMNPTLWGRTSKGTWGVRKQPGLDEKTTALNAYKDLNKNPGAYEIACHAAAKITMLAGSGYTELKRDTNVNDKDWIPGDWGYIKNILHRSHKAFFFAMNTTPGEEGENIICTGKNVFWGHTKDKNPYDSLAGWFKRIVRWGKSLPRLMKWRDRTQVGLTTKTQSSDGKVSTTNN